MVRASCEAASTGATGAQNRASGGVTVAEGTSRQILSVSDAPVSTGFQYVNSSAKALNHCAQKLVFPASVSVPRTTNLIILPVPLGVLSRARPDQPVGGRRESRCGDAPCPRARSAV